MSLSYAKAPDESPVKTRRATMPAPEATPRAGPLEPDVRSPAAMPATCVPCSQSSKEHGAPEPDAVDEPELPGQSWAMLEKQPSATTLLVRKGWLFSTPVSMIA